MNPTRTQHDAVLTLSEGDVAYGAARVLHVPELALGAGSVLALQGGNGTGKSSLLKAIAGVQATYTGVMTCRGRNLARLAPHRRAAFGIRFLPQGRRIFSRLTAGGHLRLAEKYLGRRNLKQCADASQEDENTAVADVESTRPGSTFSGGEAKLLLLQTLLSRHVHLALLDEPYAGLDPGAAVQVTAVIKRCLSAGAACIVADHTGTVHERLCQPVTYDLLPSDGRGTPFAMVEENKP